MTLIIIVCQLPHSYELPENHRMHLETTLANYVIEVLCAKFKGRVKPFCADF